MSVQLTDVIRRRASAIADMIEPGPAFRIGSPEFSFVLTGQDEDCWTYMDEDRCLKIESTVKVTGSTLVISHQLQNISEGLSAPMDVIEPLHLVFRQHAEAWRHIYASGGTKENHYPPRAWRTHDWSRVLETLTIESHPQGMSSNLYLPILISQISTAPDSPGLFCGLEWSANWYIRFEVIRGEYNTKLAAGIKVKGLCLAPGETLQLPSVHLGFFEGGPASGTNALRRYIYENVCPRYQGKAMIPLVSYDHWFGIGNNLDYELLAMQATRAAQLGVEVFVVDAAWFPGDYPLGVGNWDQVNKQKFPNGLEPLAERVRELGMDFGLWFDIEHALEGTSVHCRHPEWFLPLDTPDLTFQYYHINLARRDAQDYAIETIGGWIKQLDIRWVRWDYAAMGPQSFWDRVDPTGKVQFNYMQGLYRVLDTLIAEHPNLMVEGCAGGGRRVDLGTIRRAHTFWISDHSRDPFICRYMQARANRFLPGHLLNSTVQVNMSSGDDGFDDMSVLSRMLGKLSFDGDVAGWSERLTSRMAQWVEQFKAVRHLYVQDFYQLLPIPSTLEDWDAVEFVSYSGDDAVVFIFAGIGGGQKITRLHGLIPDRNYEVHRAPDGPAYIVRGLQLLEQGLVAELDSCQAGLWRVNRLKMTAIDNASHPSGTEFGTNRTQSS